MAKLKENNPTNGGTATEEKSTQTQQQSNTVEVDKTQIDQLVERLNKLEEEKQTPETLNAKERHQGPWFYNYKTWAGVPVLSYEKFRGDEAKPLHYKNEAGQYVSNHYLRLDLANGEQAEVEVNDFNAHFGRSDKLEPKEVQTSKDGQSVTGYVFEDSTYGEFIVDPKVIN